MKIEGKQEVSFESFSDKPLSKWFTDKVGKKMYFLPPGTIDAGIARRWNLRNRNIHFDVLFLFQSRSKFYNNEFIEGWIGHHSGILVSEDALKKINEVLNKRDLVEKKDCFGKEYLALS